MSRQRDTSPRRNLLGIRHQKSTEAASQNAGSKGNERTPLLSSMGAASESLVINKSVARDLQTGVGWGVAAFLLVNTALGAGMLNYPYAYNQIGGVLAAALMQAILLIFITSTMFILVYCADFNQDNTYHDVLLSMCGKRAQQISALSILLTCYGINITFLVIIGDQYDRIFNSLLPEYLDEYWVLDRKFTIFITSILFIWPMCYAQRLDFLRHASILGMFAMLYVAFLTVYEHYRLDEATIAAMLSKHLTTETPLGPTYANSSHSLLRMQMTTNATIQPKLDNQPNFASQKHSIQWFEPLAIVPVLCFAYQTHEVIVPVYACMKQRFIGSFMKASIFGLVILFFLYNLVGAYGYLTFGENVGPDIMTLYDAQDPIVVVGIVALVVKFITTYPPLMFCGRSALDGLYGEIRKLSTEEFKSSEKTRRYVITTLWFFSTVALAVFAPDISVTLQLLGSMASINVFVFPGMCLISLTMRLRRARLALLMGELPDGESSNCRQRAKDYYLISGSYFGAMKKNASARHNRFNNQQQNLNHHLTNGYNCCATANNSTKQQHFTATFASLIEFENNALVGAEEGTCSGEQSNQQMLLNGVGESSMFGKCQKLNGYGTSQLRHQLRQEEFERITNGSLCSSSQDHHLGSSFARPINDSLDDYSDCDVLQHKCTTGHHHHKCDIINSPIMVSNNHLYNSSSKADWCEPDTNISKDPLLDKSDGTATNDKAHYHLFSNQQQNQNQCLQNSWNNRSATGSLLDRLGSSIAPSTVAQIGISRCTAAGLYLFAAFLIIFGAFIFVLELMNVFGFL